MGLYKKLWIKEGNSNKTDQDKLFAIQQIRVAEKALSKDEIMFLGFENIASEMVSRNRECGTGRNNSSCQ